MAQGPCDPRGPCGPCNPRGPHSGSTPPARARAGDLAWARPQRPRRGGAAVRARACRGACPLRGCKASKCVRQTHAQDDPKCQSACAENVRVRAPIRPERQSACADPRGRGACGSASAASLRGSREGERGRGMLARGPALRIGAGTLTFGARTLTPYTCPRRRGAGWSRCRPSEGGGASSGRGRGNRRRGVPNAPPAAGGSVARQFLGGERGPGLPQPCLLWRGPCCARVPARWGAMSCRGRGPGVRRQSFCAGVTRDAA